MTFPWVVYFVGIGTGSALTFVFVMAWGVWRKQDTLPKRDSKGRFTK